MKYDVVALLTDMLKEAGLENVMDADLSNHNTISLNMKNDIPPIHIRNLDDTVWVWSTLGDYNLSNLVYSSSNLFPVMFDYNEDVFYTGQPCLYPIDGNLDLRAQVKEKYLESPAAFMELLDNFLNVMQAYRSAIA